MKKILLTGLAKTNVKAIELLKEHDCQVLNFPFQKMQTCLNTEIPNQNFDWTIFTSTTAVTHAPEKVFQLSQSFATVGPATATELKNQRQIYSLTPSKNYSANGIISEFRQFKEKLNCLYPASKIADDTLEKGLRQLGHKVTRINIYEPIELDLPDLPDFTDIVFFSPSGVKLFHKNFANQDLKTKKAVAIGKSTATAFLNIFDYKPILPKESTVAGVVQTLL